MEQPGQSTTKYLAFFIIMIFLWACQQANNTQQSQNTATTQENQNKPVVPEFNADSAYAFVAAQVNFGPRNPGSKGHKACGEYLEQKLKQYADTVLVQKGNYTTYDGKTFMLKNIFGQFKPTAEQRILLLAHWDTRPYADMDMTQKDKPILGANDGASGVAVLLEIARNLKNTNIDFGIDILFVDAEDYGNRVDAETYCIGTQYWAKYPPVPFYKARYGILLDMVGAPNATFAQEGYSLQYAVNIVDKVWKTAKKLGYGQYFIDTKVNPKTDDHYFVNTLARIPCIDILHYDETTDHEFAKYWHTHADNMNMIDKKTLKAVGQTVLTVILND